MSVCSLEAQVMSHPAYVMIQPECDLAVMGSALAPSGFQLPEHQPRIESSFDYLDKE